MSTLLQVDPSVLAAGVNNIWVLTVTFLIFFMHAGFAMLEAGQVRSKNVANQLTKNMLTWSVGVIVFFLIGQGIANIVGSYAVAGAFDYWNAGSDGWITWLFGAVFAMTAATIVSGAVAGRAKLRAYVAYTIMLAAVIYPVVLGFTWGGGFLASLGFTDFAGGMIVHGMGGVAGLTAAYVIGPRMGRYNEDGSVNIIPGHSLTFAVLGTLLLCFGWYGFNVGTSVPVFAVENGELVLGAFEETVGRVALTTTLGMGAGAIGAAAAALYKTGKVDTLYVANGMLAGLVGVTSNTDLIIWPGALVIGLLAGIQLPIVFEFVEKQLKIDDVCAVFPVHGSAGMLGAILLPVFAIPGADVSIVSQVIGVAVITVWTVAATAFVFGILKLLGESRVDAEHEREGLDISEHGVDTYPEFGKPETAADGGQVVGMSGTSTDDDPVIRTDGGQQLDAAPTTNSATSDNTSMASSTVDDASAVDSTTDDDAPDGDRMLRTDGGAPTDGEIKMVMAFIRPDKLSDVKQGLAEIGAPSLTVTNVSGRGSQPSRKGQWRGEEYTVDLHQKVKIECVVADIPADDVVDAIRESAHTGEKGDGKVFVLPVDDAVQIRTDKRGPEAV